MRTYKDIEVKYYDTKGDVHVKVLRSRNGGCVGALRVDAVPLLQAIL